jgi:hypothetical protein
LAMLCNCGAHIVGTLCHQEAEAKEVWKPERTMM